MIKFYGRTGTGSAAAEALFKEMEVKYEYIEVPTKQDDSTRSDPSFLAINPLGQVPFVLCDDGTVMSESSALVMSMADRFGRAKNQTHNLYIPNMDDPNRNLYTRWMFYFAGGIYYHHLIYFYAHRYVTAPVPQGELKKNTLKELERLMEHAANNFGENSYFLGEEPSPLDFYAAMLFAWHPNWVEFANSHPKIKNYCQKIMTRPKSKDVWQRHFPDFF